MSSIFANEEVDGVLLVDAKNAFNSLNRQSALRNIARSCPSLSPLLINCYRSGAEMYVGSESVLSLEGTTQGDPLAMAMYALASVPLIHRMATADTIQTWFAEDATAGARLAALRE